MVKFGDSEAFLINDNDFKKKCYEFYIEKTKKRISKYVKQYGDECLINGENIPSIYDLLNLLEFKSDWLCDGIPTNFHGDFIIDNVIESNNGYFLISLFVVMTFFLAANASKILMVNPF